MNSVDLIVLVVVLLNGAIGAYRGFTWQAFRLGSLVLAFWVGSRCSTVVAEAPPISWLGWESPAPQILSWVAIFVLTYLIMGWLGNRMKTWIERARLTSSDRSLGFLLGSAKGVIFVAIALHVLLMFKPFLPRTIEEQIWSEHGSRAAELHNEWLREFLNEMTPPDLEAGAARALTR